MAFTRYAEAASAFDDVNLPSISDVGLSGARERIMKGNLALVVGDFDTVGDQIALCALPTGARIHEIGIQSDNLGTTVTADIGLYDTDAARTVIDADAYASAVSIDNLPAPDGSVTSVRADFRWESGVNGLETMAQRIWEDGGATEDPKTQWLLVLTITAITAAAAGDLAFIIKYTHD